jgi:hypothetical protein
MILIVLRYFRATSPIVSSCTTDVIVDWHPLGSRRAPVRSIPLYRQFAARRREIDLHTSKSIRPFADWRHVAERRLVSALETAR